MKWIIALLITVAVFLPLSNAMAAETFDKNYVTAVNLSIVLENEEIHPLVEKRMQDSLKEITVQLLVGQKTDKLKAEKKAYQDLFADIADRVFNGYQVVAVELSVEPQTTLKMTLRPFGNILAPLTVSYSYSGVDSLWQPLVARYLDDITCDLPTLFHDMPQESLYWLNSVAKERVHKLASESLPDFKVIPQLYVPNNQPSLDLSVIPIGREVRSVELAVVSRNLPQMLFMDSKNHIQRVLNSLRGLPLAFLQKEQAQIVALLKQQIMQDEFFAKYKLVPQLQIDFKEDLKVIVTVDVADFNFWIKGYLDLGRSENSASGTVHLGYDFAKMQEIFLETNFYTDSIKWDFDVGITNNFTKKTNISYLRRLSHNGEDILRFEHKFTDKWAFRAERKRLAKENEFGLRYRVHEFLSAEYVFSNKENYFRLIANI